MRKRKPIGGLSIGFKGHHPCAENPDAAPAASARRQVLHQAERINVDD
jgi:hypothetical protein